MTQPDVYFEKNNPGCFLENGLTSVRSSMETPFRWPLKAIGEGCCSDQGSVKYVEEFHNY